jgi:hypothetical protein
MLATAAHAASYQVCWSADSSPAVHCGEPLRKNKADALATQANRNNATIHYWVNRVDAPPPSWKNARRVATAAAMAAAIYDARSTTQLLKAGGREENFLYGAQPSAGRLYGTNIGIEAGGFLLAEWWDHRRPEKANTLDRAGFFGQLAATAVHGAAGLHNQTLRDATRSTRAVTLPGLRETQ